MTTIERLRALLDGAAPRPWQWVDSGGEVEGDELQGRDGEMIAVGFRDDLASILPAGEALTDGRLCAAAVNAMSALLDVAEAAQRLVDWAGRGPETDPLRDALARLDGAS